MVVGTDVPQLTVIFFFLCHWHTSLSFLLTAVLNLVSESNGLTLLPLGLLTGAPSSWLVGVGLPGDAGGWLPEKEYTEAAVLGLTQLSVGLRDLVVSVIVGVK